MTRLWKVLVEGGLVLQRCRLGGTAAAGICASGWSRGCGTSEEGNRRSRIEVRLGGWPVGVLGHRARKEGKGHMLSLVRVCPAVW